MNVGRTMNDNGGKDDDEEEFFEKFKKAFLENFIANAIPFNKLPILADVSDLFLSFTGNGYVSSDNLSTAFITQIAEAAATWSEVLGEEWGGDKTSKTYYNAIYQTAKAISSVSGVSVSGAMREAVALWNNTFGEYDVTLKIRLYEMTQAEIRAEMYEAKVSGNERVYKRLLEDFENQAEIDAAIRKALREHDPRIREAAEASLNGDDSLVAKTTKEIASEWNLDADLVKNAIKAEKKAIKQASE